MNWQPSAKEFESVTALPGPERYRHFVKKVADTEVVWCLTSGGQWATSGSGGAICLPVWPHKWYAEALANGDWSGYVPTSIGIDGWQTKWLPGLARDGRGVAVFPTAAQKAVVVQPERLAEDIALELQAYS